jgi:hypothetical protein
LSALWVALLAVTLYTVWWSPWRRLRRRRDLARIFDRGTGGRNLLVAAEEALRRPERWEAAPHLSGLLVRRTFTLAADTLARARPGRLLPLPGATTVLIAAAVVCGLFCAWLVGDPGGMRRGVDRLLRPWAAGAVTPTIGLYLAPGIDHVLAGSDIVLAARDFGGGHEPVVCEVRAGSGLWRRLLTQSVLPPAGGGGRLGVVSHRRWEAELMAVREDFTYRFRRGGLATSQRAIAVWHPPLLTEFSVQIISPRYTGLPVQYEPRVPASLEVLAGSRLLLTGQVNHPVSEATLLTSRGDTLAMTVSGDGVAAELSIVEPLDFAVRLRDARGLENDARLSYRIGVAVDLPPVADLTRDDDDGRLPISGQVTLQMAAGDDFGLDRLDLMVARVSPQAADELPAEPVFESLTYWERGRLLVTSDAAREFGSALGMLRLRGADDAPGGQRLMAEHVVELDAGDLDLVPGESLLLMLEARDNRRPGTGQIGRSQVMRLTLPSAVEVLTARAHQQQDHRADLAEIRRRSQSLGVDLDRLNRELMKNPLPDWSRQQELESAVERQQALQDELARVAEQLQSDMAALAEDRLTSQELLDKMDQISELLGQLENREVDKLLQQLREAVARMSPEDVAAAIAEVSENQQEMVRRLDSALAMLKDMAREQELEGLTSLLAEMLRKQQELSEANRQQASQQKDESATAQAPEQATEQTPEQAPETPRQGADQQQSSSEELAQRQEALARELDELREQLEQALEQLKQEQASGQSSPSAEQMAQTLAEALEQLEEQQTAETMTEAAQQMQQDQSSQASQQQQQAMRDMAALYHIMLRGMEAMQMAMQQQQVTSLRRLAADLLALSQRQEQVAARVPADLHDIRISGLTRDQHRVLKASREIRQHLAEVSTDAPMQIMRLVAKLDDLIEQLGKTVRYLEDGRGALARREATTSLEALNNLVIGLLTQAQVSGGGGGAGSQSMPSISQQLREMAGAQAGLNGLAQQLREMMEQQGRLGEQARQQLQHLQQGQGELAGRTRELAELERELQDGNRLLGDLDHLAGDMEGVVNDLNQGLVDEETLVRQERILGRLLDLHNSARKRNFDNRREGRTAGELFAEQPGVGRRDHTTGAEDPFQRRYQPVEKAPAEYRDLVRRYFRALDDLNAADAHETPRSRELP